MKVRVLQDVVIDQIAAGEVVERPASVLKELMENSLDAGARTLDISLKGGGVGMVRVVDDGEGMVRDDAVLCIERHATSKIREADDLVGVSTLGFRGEALPSIASVSRFELRTRTADDEVGTQVEIEGGRLIGVTSVACNVGTDLAVRSLFFNVPARRKFLRSKETELAHCLEAVHRAIMMRPEVDVTVKHEGRALVRAPASTELSVRVRDLIGEDAKVLVPVEVDDQGVKVRGLIGPVGVHRASSVGNAYLYVNGRFVRDPVLRRAVTEAYQGALPKGRYPVVVLDVALADGEVDCNVHPAKTEVRFRDPRTVTEVVSGSLREALRGPAPRRVATRPSFPASEALPLLDRVEMNAAPKPAVVAHPDDDPMLRARLPLVHPARHEGIGLLAAEPEAGPVLSPPPVTPVPTVVRPTVVRSEPIAPPTPTAGPLPRLDLVVAERFGVGSVDGGLRVIDLQIVASRLAELALRAGGVASQPLLAPTVVTLPRAELAAVIAAADALSDLGVELRAFGPGTVAVMSVPQDLQFESAERMLLALARAAVRGEELAPALAEAADHPVRELYQAKELVVRWREAGLGEPPGRLLTVEELARWCNQGGEGG